MTFEDEERRRRAIEIWERAHAHQMRGDLEQAIQLYRESLAFFPTAEAHTFLGWTYSFQGRLDEAIAECHKAIAVDPDFGNPYNDIGVYLMQKGDLEGAIPWLEKAKQAPRYEPRQFPYMNLGRIYLRRGQWTQALRELEAGVRAAPNDEDVRKMLHELRAKFN
jgi:Tfp pilus assembly protein PilF